MAFSQDATEHQTATFPCLRRLHTALWMRELAPPEAASHLINKFWYSRIRDILGISWVRMRDQRITNEHSAAMSGVPDWRVLVGRRYTRWLGHVARMAPTRLARQALVGFAKGRTQLKTGRRRNLVSHAKTALKGLPELDSRIWAHSAQDKTVWNNLYTTWSRMLPNSKMVIRTNVRLAKNDLWKC